VFKRVSVLAESIGIQLPERLCKYLTLSIIIYCVSTHKNIILFLGKRADYDATMHIEIPHVSLGIISKMLLLNEQGRCTDKMVI
jgi:hypothetical protein